jgi:flagellar L-ring protein precursor FlgH
MTHSRFALATGLTLAVLATPAAAQSLMSRTLSSGPTAEGGTPHALRDVSMFAIAPPELRNFQKHDLIQIIVRETSKAESTHELETEKDYKLKGKIGAWPDFRLEDLLQLQIMAGRTTDLPELDVSFSKDFEGEGDYSREDDLTARLSAEVIDILPNGNLVLEAKTEIKTDEEQSTIRVTGVCRPDDVTAANTVLSNQIHDLMIEKVHAGELKKANEKGIIAKILDTIFAF